MHHYNNKLEIYPVPWDMQILRGGSFRYSGPSGIRPSNRHWGDSVRLHERGDVSVGFRCMKVCRGLHGPQA